MTSAQPRSPENRIVVGVDGSESSKQAIRWARFLAQATGGTLELVAAWLPFTAWGWEGAGWAAMPADWNPARDAEDVLGSTIVEVFGDDRPAGLEVTLREGRPAKVLLDASENATMLVVGSRGHGGFSGLLLGSVSSACAEHATCPVVVIHGSTPPPIPTPQVDSKRPGSPQ